jgi:hypothetical protein
VRRRDSVRLRSLRSRRLHQLPRPERPRRCPQPAVARQNDSVALGVDFRPEFNTDAKITEFIRSGSVIGRAPIVSMPHWGGIISKSGLAGARHLSQDAQAVTFTYALVAAPPGFISERFVTGRPSGRFVI